MKNTHMETRSLLDRLWTRKIKKYSSDIFNLFKQIWNNRDIVIIEGDKTLFGVNNELLNNASTIKRIIAPALNAYDYKNEIIQFSKNLPKSNLILISLGPAAKIISLELIKNGFRVLDVGHLDIEYEWFLRNATTKISIPNKYVNENEKHPYIGGFHKFGKPVFPLRRQYPKQRREPQHRSDVEAFL